MRIDLHCICGAFWKAAGYTEQTFAQIKEAWASEHSGEGHAACTAVQAARARRRIEKSNSQDFVVEDDVPIPEEPHRFKPGRKIKWSAVAKKMKIGNSVQVKNMNEKTCLTRELRKLGYNYEWERLEACVRVWRRK